MTKARSSSKPQNKHVKLLLIALVVAAGLIAAVSTFASSSFAYKTVDLTVRSKSHCIYYMHAERFINEGGSPLIEGKTKAKQVNVCSKKRDQFGAWYAKVRFRMKHNGHEWPKGYAIYVNDSEHHRLRTIHASTDTPHSRFYLSV